LEKFYSIKSWLKFLSELKWGFTKSKTPRLNQLLNN